MRGAAVTGALWLLGCGSSALVPGWEGTAVDASLPDAGIDFADAYPTGDPDPDAWAPSPTFDAGATGGYRCTGKTLGSGSRDEDVTSGGLARVAHLHVPTLYDPTSGAMLVLAFHGFFETGALQEVQSRMDPSSDAKGYIVAYPEGIANSWNAGDCCGDAWTNSVDDVQFTRDLLAAIENDYCIDPKRIFATGFSNGGFFAHRLGCEMSDVFGAIAPVSGVLGIDPSSCLPTRPIPVLDFHGTADPIVPYDGGTPIIPIDVAGVLDFRSVTDTLDFWINENGCLAPETTIFTNGDATCMQWGLCKGGADVVHCKIDQGGHQWPGGVALPVVGKCSTDISATDTIYDFFAAHPLP
jgi:polyhydroxybutyrate depolymerase